MVDISPVLAPLVRVVTVSIVLIRRLRWSARPNPGSGGATRSVSLGGPRGARGCPAYTAANRSPNPFQLPRPTLTRR